jgi:hypothetical protein
MRGNACFNGVDCAKKKVNCPSKRDVTNLLLLHHNPIDFSPIIFYNIVAAHYARPGGPNLYPKSGAISQNSELNTSTWLIESYIIYG